MANKILYTYHKFSLLVLILISLNGCSATGGYKGIDAIHAVKGDDDRITSVYDQAKADNVKITDDVVFKFANNIKNFMEIRMNKKRTWRKISAGTQVLTAAAAAALTVAEKSVALIAGLSGFSAIIPELQNIFQAKEGAIAFRNGRDLISVALDDFINASRKKISDSELTCAGVELSTRVSASIRLVDTALLKTIPTIDDMKEAVTRVKLIKFKNGATDPVDNAEKEVAEKEEALDDKEAIEVDEKVLAQGAINNIADAGTTNKDKAAKDAIKANKKAETATDKVVKAKDELDDAKEKLVVAKAEENSSNKPFVCIVETDK